MGRLKNAKPKVKRMSVQQIKSLDPTLIKPLLHTRKNFKLHTRILDHHGNELMKKRVIAHVKEKAIEGNPQALKILVKIATKHLDQGNRYFAIKGLISVAQEGNHKTVNSLEHIVIKDKNKMNRRFGISGLISLARQGNLQALKWLKHAATKDPDSINREHAILELGRLAKKGNPQAKKIVDELK